ncbi:MAG: hypothetical protein ACI9XO_001759 [Paraglaciecola sp.]|jgi:hypothetical protein
MESFNEINKLHNSSDFKLLSYFSVLESLLTHKPKDSGDSITRQIKSKIPLINNRLSSPIDLKLFFDQGNEDTIITKLYGLRSSIAHGERITKVEPILKSKLNVLVFMEHIVKEFICQALLEPQLFTDLKRC